MRPGTMPVVFVATITLLGGGTTAWHAITDGDPPPSPPVVVFHDYYTPGWQADKPGQHYALWSAKPLAQTSAGMKIHAPHLNALHGGLFHRNRIGGPISRRIVRGMFRGLFH